MKKVTLIKRCNYTPLGSTDRIPGRPNQVALVSAADAEKMCKGGVAVECIEKLKPKKKAAAKK